MQEGRGLEDWIETYAEYGEKSAILKVWKAQIPREPSRFEAEGFKVTFFAPSENPNQSYYKFDWSHPTVEGKMASRMLEISLANS